MKNQLKKALKLKCKYSSVLSKKDIKDINASKLYAPDWVLISLKPFTSEETLTITMKDGQVFTVKVTDAQMALNIHSNVVDANGNNIHLAESVQNSFDVYQKPSTETDPTDGQEVKVVGSEDVDYNDYSTFGDSHQVTIGTNGTGMMYAYDITPGMYYVQLDEASVPDTITDSEGHTWEYVGTRIETEYAWRNGPDDEKIHSADGSKSIPEVVGPYKNYAAAPEGHEWEWNNDGTWEALMNTFLEFHIYNVYKPQSGDLIISKTVTVNGEGTTTNLADGTYSFEIWNADGTEQITETADGTAIGELKITVTNGQSEPIKIEGLNGGSYIIREVDSTNTATMEMTDKEAGYDAALRGIVVNIGDEDADAVFVNDYGSVAQTVKKIWDGEDIPSSLEVTLYENEVASSHIVTLSQGNGWTATINNLPKYKDGKPIHYTWVEGHVPEGFFITGYNVVETENSTTTTITNTYRKYEFTTYYEGTKEWFDDNNKMDARPEALKVTLYASYVTNPGSETPIYGEPEATFFEPIWTKEILNFIFPW